jgi:hypothetical protein
VDWPKYPGWQQLVIVGGPAGKAIAVQKFGADDLISLTKLISP